MRYVQRTWHNTEGDMAVYTSINDPSAYFHTQLYTGTGSLNSITNNANAGNFKPDWLWIKNRSAGWSHILFDSSRGTGKSLMADSTDAEVTNNSRGYVSAFGTDGFTVGAGSAGSDQVNTNSQNYVAWQWKANGGTTSSNGDGGVTGTVQANTTAGFSIITYTGTGSASTVGHGLSDTPDWIIYKRRSGGTKDWIVYHIGTGSKGMILNSTSAGDSASSIFGGNTPTSTTIPIGSATETNSSGETHIAYAFAQKQGFSKFGTYPGNGLSNGPYVYTGFKPAWLIIKRTDDTANWHMYDNKRDTRNPFETAVKANGADAEYTTSNKVDFNSNGFKPIGASQTTTNASGATYIYMAFAESPFVSSAGVPTTAK